MTAHISTPNLVSNQCIHHVSIVAVLRCFLNTLYYAILEFITVHQGNTDHMCINAYALVNLHLCSC